MNISDATQALHRKCEDLALRLEPVGPNCTVFAEGDKSEDNILWSVDLLDEEHRAGCLDMMSASIELRQSMRYGAILFDGSGYVTIAAVTRGEGPLTRDYAISQEGSQKVLIPTHQATLNPYLERLFEMSRGNDPAMMQLAELGLAPAVIYGHPRLEQGGLGEQKPQRRTVFH